MATASRDTNGRVERRTRPALADAATSATTTSGRSNGKPGLGKTSLQRRKDGECLGEAHGAAEKRDGHSRPDSGLRPRRGLDRAVRQAHRGAPRRRPVNQNAVLERHSAEAKLGHPVTVARPHARPVAGNACAQARASSRRRRWRSSAASRGPYSRPSTVATGITSRTDDDVNTSSASSSRSSG